MTQQPPSGPRPPRYPGFTTHSIRHTTLGRIPLNLYLITHNTHKRQTFMPPVGFEPAIPASERPQTHVLDRNANRYTTHTHTHTHTNLFVYYIDRVAPIALLFL
jgi:hypothetical protein